MWLPHISDNCTRLLDSLLLLARFAAPPRVTTIKTKKLMVTRGEQSEQSRTVVICHEIVYNAELS